MMAPRDDKNASGDPSARPRSSGSDLQAPEEHFRYLAEHIDATFWVASADLRRVIYVSPAFEQIFGRTCEELYEDINVFLDVIHPEDRSIVIDGMREGKAFDSEYRIVRGDGSMRWIHGRAFPVRDESGEVVRIAGITTDISDRKRTELELRGQNRVLVQLTAEAPLEKVLAAIAEAQESPYPNLRCAIMLVDPNQECLRLGAAPSLPDFFTATLDGLPIGEGACGLAAASGKPVIIEDIASHDTDTLLWEQALRAGLAACWSQPIIATDGEILGTLALYHLRAQRPTERQSAALERSARLVGFAIGRFSAGEKLRNSERSLAEAQRIAGIGSWEWNIGHNRVTWSDALYRIAGIEPGGFGASYEAFLELVHPDDRNRVQSRIEAAFASGESYEIDCRLVRPDGSIRYLTSRAQIVLDDAGEPVRMFGTSQDVTERRLAEEERRGLELQMRQSQQMESLGVLAGGIAHDFNNLLSVIIGNSGLALEDLEGDSPLDDKLQRVRESAQYAAELVSQILTYSGKPSIDLEPVSLSSVLTGMLGLVNSSLSDNCVLTTEIEEDLPAIEADATQIRQIVLNLATNASECLGERGGNVWIRTGVMIADAGFLAPTLGYPNTAPGEYVYLEVEDDGPGMDSDIRALVFDPFFTTKFSGRGLGLAAILGIVRGHKGAIELDTEFGRGTRFRVLFPSSSATLPEKEIIPSTEPLRGSGCVLAVDDEPWVLDIAREFLERSGYRVITAHGGRAGLDLFDEHAAEIDVVLLDLTMPDVDGPEAFDVMRASHPEIPVILVSGYNQEMVARRFATEEAAGFLRKPYEPEDLVKAVSAAITARAAAHLPDDSGN